MELIRHLPGDVEPIVVVPADDGIALELKDLGVTTALAPMGAWRKAAGHLRARFLQIPRIRAAIGQFHPDAIHSNEFHIIPQAFRATLNNQISQRVPLCGHVRLSITPRQIANYSLSRCARIVAVSEAVKSLFEGTPLHERVKVVYNGVDVGAIAPEGDIPQDVAAWIANMGEPRPLVAGLLGLVSERKNQMLAVEAVAEATRRGCPTALLLAGDAFKGSVEYGERLKAAIAASPARDRILWLPFRKDVAAIYRAMDVNLLVSSEEGFGRTIIEAGAAGRPSIGTRIGGIPELIVESGTGWLVPDADPGALADALCDAARDPARRGAMGAAALARARGHFTIQAHARRMVEVWRECAEAGAV